MATNDDLKDKLYYYIESDGRVYLIERDGKLSFPVKGDKLPFEVIEKKVMKFDDFTAMYVSPVLEKHPHEWHAKDELPGMDDVHPMVRECIHMSFPRTVSEAIIMKNDEVLLVNASRGVTVGFWNLPGGFMEYGENPEECIVREVKEEVGVDARVLRLVGVYDMASKHHPYHILAFVYLCEVESYDLKPDPDEIAEVGWFGLDSAISKTKSHFTKLALADLKKE